ncbi:3798_t:CDS:2 [Racocetra persica]|uniref:3798_t:CDS:1 n=1 Tax=Racocetra persica TaxID=160502 RepID=A0ACA9KPI2_9GLOM|nr:3798_t:CDS:2 [Racocetra persica]
MSTADVHLREILSTLRQDDLGKLAILKTIYNARDKICCDNFQSCTPIQALLDKLVEGNFEHDYQCDQNDNLTHLFFAYSKSIALTKTYNSVLLIDCTYKTNKFKMPLLHVALNHVAHIFENVPKSKVIVTDCELALMHAVHTVFPESQNVLCVWHIEKNVLTSCKHHFQINDEWIEFMECWSNLIKSQTEADFDNQQRPSEIKDVLQQRWKEYSQQFSTLSAHQRSAIISKMPDLFQESTTVVQNPQVRQTREYPVGARNHAQSSTERDLSAFELVKSGRKCGICRESGHNSRTCSNAESTSEDSEA